MKCTPVNWLKSIVTAVDPRMVTPTLKGNKLLFLLLFFTLSHTVSRIYYSCY